MKVTLITVCRNVAPVIAETLDSALGQAPAEIKDLEAYMIFQGNPVAVRERVVG